MDKQSLAVGALVAAIGLAAPAAAQAHVTINPREAQAGGFTELVVRVPTERDDASTVKVAVQLPDGFAEASYEPKPGWTVAVRKQKLATPITTDDGPVTEEVKQITWTGSGKGVGRIGPGEYMDFPLSVQVPDKPGSALTFKALQTYSDGKVVRWIGDEQSDTPAPTLQVAGATTDPAGDDDGGGGSDGLAIAALAVGVVALLVGGASLAGRRRVGATA